MPRICVRVNLFLCCLDHQFIIQFFFAVNFFSYLFRILSCFCSSKAKEKEYKRDKETRGSAHALALEGKMIDKLWLSALFR